MTIVSTLQSQGPERRPGRGAPTEPDGRPSAGPRTGAARRRLRRAVDARRRALAMGREAGMATAEYAIATVAAAGFAGLLLLVLRSDEVRETLAGLVRSALAV